MHAGIAATLTAALCVGETAVVPALERVGGVRVGWVAQPELCAVTGA